MSKNMKLLIASVIILACSVGFFAGASIFQSPFVKAKTIGAKSNDYHRFERREARRPDRQRNRFSLDSILQVTPEQRIKLDSHRLKNDSLRFSLTNEFKIAEVALQEALGSKPIDEGKVETARKKLLELSEKRLNQRIAGMRFFTETLTPEQYKSFNHFHKRRGARLDTRGMNHGAKREMNGERRPSRHMNSPRNAPMDAE